MVCIGLQQSVYAQPICGFDDAHQNLLNQNSNYSQSVSQFNTQVAQWLNSQPNISSLLTTNSSGDTIYEIPLVVHVMHEGSALGGKYNISQGRIDSTIDYVNKTFAANWPNYPGPSNGGTKFPFRFELAKRDPSCNTTTGVTRIDVSTTYSNYSANGVNRSGSSGVSDGNLKALSVWPNDRYYNIWVVNRIDGIDGYPGSGGPFVAGYAYFPGAPASVDGTVILASQMGIDRETLPHELGHAFSLYHTFEGSNQTSMTCPPNTNCGTQGDRVCDTEPHWQYGAGSCFSGQTNNCTSTTFNDATAKNIMNYANCTDRFTAGQRDRFIGALISQRSSLISSSASVPIPTTGLPTVCVPGHDNPTSNQNYGPRNVRVYDAGRTYMDVTSDGFTGDGNVAYRDFTCQHRISLEAGKTYDVQFSSRFGENGAVYIDYNNDGILGNSAGERLTVRDSTTAPLHTATFTVPMNAVSCTPVRMRVISDRTTSSLDSCKNMVQGQTEDYEVLILGGTTSAGGSVIISNPPIGGNPSCFGTTLKFKSTPSTGLNITGYQWYINSTAISGQTKDSLESNVFVDKDTVYVKMYYVGLCGIDTATSNRVVVERRLSIPPAVTIGVTGGTNPTCEDDTVVLSVVGTSNPGANPTYYWRLNGTPINGATTSSLSVFQGGGNKYTAVMKSSAGAPCATPDTAISNEIEISYTKKAPSATIALTIGTNPGCEGQTLQFTATPTIGGTSPTYQWRVNGSNVPGATNVSYSASTLNNNDTVRVVMVSNSTCADPTTAISDSIVVKHQKITADITIAQTTGTNPACEGKPIIFSANTNNAGKNPNFQWLINGNPVSGATSPIYNTDSLKNFDTLQCVLIATDPCVDNPLDTSNQLVIGITPSKRPKVTVSVTQGKNPGCLDSLVELTATAVDLGTNPSYTWILNGFPTVTGNVFTSSSLLDGNTVIVRANQTDNGCYLPDTVYSNPLVMVRSITPIAPVISLIGNKMYTNFDSSFVWFGPDGEMSDYTRDEAYPGKVGTYYAVTNNKGCWSKPSNRLGITLLDINSIDLGELRVYPNPTSDKVVLDWNGTIADYNYEILNSVGQTVSTGNIENTTRKEISLEQLASGVYHILLKAEDGRIGVVRVTLNK